jgi:hypothetical protein
VWVCIILVYVCMYVYTWRSVIFSLFRMKTFHYVVILEVTEKKDSSSGKNNEYFFLYVDAEEEFLFLLYKNLGCRFDKFSFFLFKHVLIASCWVHPMLSVR